MNQKHYNTKFSSYVPGDNGSMYFWDWKSGYNFQRIQTTVQPGSIDSEAGIFAMAFDKSGSRLLTCEADKTIKVYKEDDTAVRTYQDFISIETRYRRKVVEEKMCFCCFYDYSINSFI